MPDYNKPFDINSIDFNTPLPSVKSDLFSYPNDSLNFNQNNLLPKLGNVPEADNSDITGSLGSNISATLKGFGSLADAFAAYKQYQLGKATLAQNRAAFNTNLANQAKITNAEIEDRALRRAAQRSDITGDLEAIKAAAEKSAASRRISDKPI